MGQENITRRLTLVSSVAIISGVAGCTEISSFSSSGPKLGDVVVENDTDEQSSIEIVIESDEEHLVERSYDIDEVARSDSDQKIIRGETLDRSQWEDRSDITVRARVNESSWEERDLSEIGSGECYSLIIRAVTDSDISILHTPECDPEENYSTS